ncbi:MAG: tetratricopeptide repeat protein [Chlorobi bacterium]|nr:tetratricopeptide repeat protein [Chlorobiota bacterium]
MHPRAGILALTLLLAVTFSCSRKSTSPVSRAYHKTTAEYNILFHSRQSLRQGVEELKRKAQSDYYSELPLEGLEFDDKIYLPGQSKTAALSRAEEKAAKAVQKHSMEIRGSEYNPKMDEAMLLLGMSRYYDQRYVAALDAFTYALDNYYDTDLRPEFLLWRAKTLLKLGNTRLARRRLLNVAFSADARPDTRAWAYAFASETFREDSLNDTVALYLSMAARTAKNRKLRQTLAYKAAQVWEQLGKNDSALAMLDLIRRYKQPEEYALHAEWYRMYLTREDTASHERHLKILQRQLKNYYFHKYYPDIHYHTAAIYAARGDTATAVTHYTGAARSTNKTLKRLAYEHLADIYWARKDFWRTGKYLDSMLAVMPSNTLEYLLVRQRRRSMDNIVKWEEFIRRQDSILTLATLDSTERRARIEAYIRRLKASNEPAATAGEERAEGTFYFYNTRQVEKGRQAFQRRWGERPLEDLWRLSEKRSGAAAMPGARPSTTPQAAATEEKDTLNADYLLARLPHTPEQLDSIRALIRRAHLYLGMYYADDKFREYELAARHLDTVLTSQPAPEEEARAYYLYYKLHKKAGRPREAARYASLLTQKFPDSPFTQYIRSEDEEKPASAASFTRDFRRAYDLYREGRWDAALDTTLKGYERYKEHPEAPKFLLLIARIRGDLQGPDAYIATLEEVKKLYPDSEYARLAGELITKVRFVKAKYSVAKDSHPYYLVFSARDTARLAPVRQCLNDVYRELEAGKKTIFTHRYDARTVTLLTGPFLSKESAAFVLEKLKEKKCDLPPAAVISRQNYIILHLTKQKLPVP